jgi:sporulation protein YlmC with PRC-barrel domain
MLRSTKELYGNKLGTADEEIGHVKDFYFDDRSWVIRYVIVDTGSWLAGRLVLLSPHAFGNLHQSGKILRVNLTRQQIENSPSIQLHQPVSRQYEEEYHRYYGWPCYWQGDGLWGMSGFPFLELPPQTSAVKSAAVAIAKAKSTEAHLRSTQAVNGYHLQASNGILGHVCDFLVDPKNWAIDQLVIKTGHRFSGKEVQIPTSKVERISYDESAVIVDLTTEAVEQSPVHHLVPVPIGG